MYEFVSINTLFCVERVWIYNVLVERVLVYIFCVCREIMETECMCTGRKRIPGERKSVLVHGNRVFVESEYILNLFHN